jgi:short-subunit dehydrogenase
MAESFEDRYGPWAFVAGASMGIGRAFAHGAASRGLNVLMLARGAELLDATAREVAEQHGVQTRTLAADLASPEIGDLVAAASDDLEIGLFVYNAAIAPHGQFVDVALEHQLRSVAVNCATPVMLCNLLAGKMAVRGRGGIALISSLGALAGAVNFGTYNAGKAFQWILAETLWAELGPRGVDVTSMLVGATSGANYGYFQATLDTELCRNGDTDDPLERARWRLMNPATPAEVAEQLYRQLGDGPVCYTNASDALVGEATLRMARRDAVHMWEALQRTSTRAPEKQAL